MAKPCPECGLDTDKFGTRHRCITGKLAGERKATRLEAERLARGELDPATLTPPSRTSPTTPNRSDVSQPGRLAPRKPYEQPVRKPEPTNADILSAITILTAQFEKLHALLAIRETSTDA